MLNIILCAYTQDKRTHCVRTQNSLFHMCACTFIDIYQQNQCFSQKTNLFLSTYRIIIVPLQCQKKRTSEF